jgi:hypothetical protein
LTTTELVGEACGRAIDGDRKGPGGKQFSFQDHCGFAGKDIYLRLRNGDIQTFLRHIAVAVNRKDERMCVKAQQEKG